ncbi:hypothetical protein MTO96_002727 [Rhipicephalus appendiculatus]
MFFPRHEHDNWPTFTQKKLFLLLDPSLRGDLAIEQILWSRGYEWPLCGRPCKRRKKQKTVPVVQSQVEEVPFLTYVTQHLSKDMLMQPGPLMMIEMTATIHRCPECPQ